jgi:flagellar biosynthetic protein FliQ
LSGEALLDLWRGALGTLGAVGAPFLVAAVAVGLVTSLFQAATQLQDNVLSFVPKLLAIAGILGLAAPWLLGQLVRYTESSVLLITRIGQEGLR